ncbi:ATP-NAD kinase-like domain-containing protein [Daedaleopsis nitida]|nr:ATP-NAD kinase-like domain-containing protein [Daedaleopsis nitida]
MAATTRELSLGAGPNASKFTLTDSELVIERPADKKWAVVKVPLRNVLWAELDKDVFEVSLLAKKKPNALLSLLHITGPVGNSNKADATAFTEAVLSAAYAGLPTQRRLKVFVNPNSGPGKAVRYYHKKIEPVFNAARCKLDVTFTTHGKHAQGIIEKLPLDAFDAVVVMSGDGLIHEVLNGYAAHAEAAKAFGIPISPIPTGSGNGQAINLLGIEESKDLSVAALNAIKGRPMASDLFSVTHSGKRYISFMSQSIGLMAEVDLGTEHLRFMGGQRFVVGFIYEVMKHKACPAKISIKVAEKDKRKMADVMHTASAHAKSAFSSTSTPPADVEEPAAGLPELKYTGGAQVDDEGWITFDKPFIYLYAGQGPYVSADLVQFPVSLPNDGLIDVVLQERINRMTMLKAIDGAERGLQYWQDSQHYFKAHAYRVEFSTSKDFLSIDGEAYPLAPFEVEVHKGLGTFLSMHGCYQFDFPIPADKNAK